MPPTKTYKRFPVGAFRKEKKEQTLELARKRASLDSDVNRLQQKFRRLESKVSFSFYHRDAGGVVANTALMILMAVFYLLSFFMLSITISHLFQCAFSSIRSQIPLPNELYIGSCY